jgi:DNA modification methylase
MLELNKIYNMDCLEGLKQLDDNSINCCVTSPPYWGLRDYGVEGQLGLESTPEEYVTKMVEIFREVKRVLRKDGTLWLNLGDSYCGTGNKGKYKDPKYLNGRNGQKVALNNKIKGLKAKDLVGIPWMVAFALRADGWYLRQDIIWHKPNAMPESVKDRCTKAHEYIFLLSKSRKYYYDHEAIKEPAAYDGRKDTLMKGSLKYEKGVVPGQVEHSMAAKGHERWKKNESGEYVRNKRSVWTIPTKPFKEAHFAVFPPDLIEPCILAGCPAGGVVLDPFMGSGTTGMVAAMYQRNFIGFELNPEYCKMAEKRIANKVITKSAKQQSGNALF